MNDVILETRDKHFVHRGQTLPYQHWPEVMFWGERIFSFAGMSPDEPSVPVYREVAMGFVDLRPTAV